MADSFNVDAARKAGYSDDEILSHLTTSRKFDIAGALNGGYSKPEIIQHLSSSPAVIKDAPQEQEGAFSRFISSVGGALNPMPAIQEFINRPSEIAKANAAADSIKKLKQQGVAENDPRMADAIHEAMGANVGTSPSTPPVLPVGTEPGFKAADQVRQGDLAGAAGTVVGAGIPIAVAAAVPPVYRAVKGAFEDNPAIAANKAWRPTANSSDFPDIAQPALEDIKRHGGVPEITTNEQARVAAKATIENHKQALEAWLDRGRQMGAKISTDPLVKATQDALSSSTKLENPEQASLIVKQAQRAYGGRTLGVDESLNLLKDKNAELESFYDKSTGKQQASVTSGSPQAVVKAQVERIRDMLYRSLDPENEGAGPREIQQRTGHAIEILDDADKRRVGILREKPVSKAGAVGKVAAGVVDLIGAPFHGDIEGAIGKLSHPVVGPSDAMLARAFKAVGPGKPLPMPPEFTPRGLLERGPLVTPPPADESFQPGMVNARKVTDPQTGKVYYTAAPEPTLTKAEIDKLPAKQAIEYLQKLKSAQ